MKLAMRCLPVGALPYNSVKSTTAMMAKLFQQTPFIALLPNISEKESVLYRLLENLPGLSYDDGKLIIKTGTTDFKTKMFNLEKAFNKPEENSLEEYGFNAEFLEKFFQMIKKFKSPNAYINILGPFTFYQMLSSAADKQILVDKSYKKLFIQAVCVKALWVMKEIKKYCSDTVPVVIIEEPILNQFGMLKRESEEITDKFVIDLLSRVIKKLKQHGAIVGVQCMDKCDWSIPIRAGADLISFDAYNNPNNIAIIPKIIKDFLCKGGIINWGIVPVASDNIIKSLNIDYLQKRLATTMDGVVISGVPDELLKKSSTVSLNGNTDKLSIMFAEKAIILAQKLGASIGTMV